RVVVARPVSPRSADRSRHSESLVAVAATLQDGDALVVLDAVANVLQPQRRRDALQSCFATGVDHKTLSGVAPAVVPGAPFGIFDIRPGMLRPVVDAPVEVSLEPQTGV